MTKEKELSRIEEYWYEEIIRETEHYYQGEIQQEQRASWILASVCVLVALLISADFEQTNLLITIL